MHPGVAWIIVVTWNIAISLTLCLVDLSMMTTGDKVAMCLFGSVGYSALISLVHSNTNWN